MAGIDPEWATGPRSQTKYDLYHFIGNVGELVGASKKTPLFKSFMVTVADVFTKLLPGEMERVVHHCREAGMSWDEISALRRRYFRRMCRRHRPEPEQLLREFHDVYECFRDLDDPDQPGRKFFVNDHRRLFLKLCRYIQLGFLSDVPGMNMHVFVRRLSTGFEVFRSLASTSHLEGMHAHQNAVVAERGRHASLRYNVALLRVSDWRWNTNALAAAGAVPRVGHFHLWERDALCDIVAGTPLARLDIPCLRGWTRLDTSRPPVIPRDIIFAGKDCWSPVPGGSGGVPSHSGVQDVALQGRRHSATSTTEWLEKVTQCKPWPSRLRDNASIAATVRALRSTEELTPQQLYALTGIRASERDIEDVRQRVAAGVAVTKALELVYFRRLCQRIRAPASKDIPRARAVLAPAATPSDAGGAGQLPGRHGPFRISHAAVPARRVGSGTTATPVTAVVVGRDDTRQAAGQVVAAAQPTDRRDYYKARRVQAKEDVRKRKQETKNVERQKQMRIRERDRGRKRAYRARKGASPGTGGGT